MSKKHRLILVIGADTQDLILEALRELGKDRTLHPSGCLGCLPNGADFDYSLSTTEHAISIAQLIEEFKKCKE